MSIEFMPIEIKEILKKLTVESPEKEICGFILKNWSLIPIDNVADNPREFRMDPKQQMSAVIQHSNCLMGVYHSHPGGSLHPSDTDEIYAPVYLRYWIATTEEVAEWDFKYGKANLVKELD